MSFPPSPTLSPSSPTEDDMPVLQNIDFDPTFRTLESSHEVFSIFSKNTRSDKFLNVIYNFINAKLWHNSHQAALWAIFGVLT
jgi:hypothetical protein